MPDREVRRALARLHRAIEKARREARGLRERLEDSEAESFPGEEYAELDRHLDTAVALVKREQARQQAKILRAGGIASGLARGPARHRDGGLGTSPKLWSDKE